ncbi:MAG: RodZ domain-containing protein [Candidatus Acidiferrales bacterium]
MDQPRAQEGNQSTAKDGFGVHLRREREMRGVTLEEISSATRIGTRFLDALETEHWDVLPGGVFNRGFVRSTAQFLGLDPEAMLAEYTLATTDSARPAAAVLIHSQSSWTPRTAPQTRDNRSLLPWIVLIAILAAAGGWFGLKHYRAVRHARATDAPVAATSGSSAATISETGPAPSSARSAAPDATSSTAQAPALQPPADSPVAPAPTTPVTSSASDAATDAAPASSGANAPAAAGTAPPASSTSASGPLILKIEAGRATSVKVSIDGHKSFNGKIPAGGSKTFQANEVFYVTARDAGGVLLELNGQTLPPLGPQGRSGSIRLTRETLKSQDGTSH